MPKFITPRKKTLAKGLYDFMAAGLSISLAFLLRIALDSYLGINSAIPIEQKFSSFSLPYVLSFAGIMVGCLAAFGFYSAGLKQFRQDSPLYPLLAVSCGPVAWSLIMYYAVSAPSFPRGVSLIAWGLVLVFIAAPRILKYYFQREWVMQFSSHSRVKVRNVLIIGGAGYIGSQLVDDLLERGYRVRVLDSLLFGDFPLEEFKANDRFELMQGDFRNVQTVATALREMDAVVHLGGIVGDPACALDDDFTIDVNLSATIMLAELCKVFKINRFIFASTCSVYGKSESGEQLTEESPLNPVSLYARTKIAAEKILKELSNPGFSPTILRFATLFGLSRRPRFDLIVNLLSAKALQDKKITVFGGEQWRPFVHTRDVSQSICAILEAPLEKVGNQVFNVGSSSENYKIIDVAKIIHSKVPEAELLVDDKIDDPRDYNVSFEKLQTTLKLQPFVSVAQGVQEIQDAIIRGEIKDYRETRYSNLVQTKMLLSETENNTSSSTVPLRQTAKSILNEVRHH